MKKVCTALVLCLIVILCTAGLAEGYTAGTYEATVAGHNAPVTIAVTVSGSAIEKVEATVENETAGVGKVAIERIAAAIVREQSLAVDVVSGASVTSEAVLAAAGEALAKAGADVVALKKAPEKAPAQDEEYTADVVVIGGGGAGLAAAISAAENGAKVIVLEKLDILGGTTNISDGAFNAVDPARQSAEGIEDSVEDFTTYTFKGGQKSGKIALISVMTENGLSAIEWLEGLGVTFKDEVSNAEGTTRKRSHYPATPSGNSYIRVFEKTLSEKENVTILTGTEATGLITENGAVTGVNAVGKAGNAVTVKAKSTVIATGGFGANKEMLKQYNTGVWSPVDVSALGCAVPEKAATGDGIQMATAIGADVAGMSGIQIHPCGTPGTGHVENIRNTGRNRIFVSLRGYRFVNETVSRDKLAQAVFNQDQYTYYIIMNSVRYPSRDFVDSNGNTMEDMLATGEVIEAETLDELAEKTGLDPKKLKMTVEDYNLIVRGEMEDSLGFEAKENIDLELKEGPWYACKKVPTVLCTMGGLKINPNAEVVDTNEAAIPGLFACGEVTGGIHGASFITGNSIADCMTYGRLAGANAAKAAK